MTDCSARLIALTPARSFGRCGRHVPRRLCAIILMFGLLGGEGIIILGEKGGD
jgi:hypothetical protein